MHISSHPQHEEPLLPRHQEPKNLLALSRTATAVRLLLLLGLGSSTLLGGLPLAWAQSVPNANSGQESSIDSSENIATLQEVRVKGTNDPVHTPYAGGQVTTGSRVGLLGDKDFMETPFNTISYTELFMADSQARDIQEVIAKTDPSVFSSSIAGEALESYTIRGLPSAVGDVTINGLAGMAGYYRNAPEMFERVEVLKGPSALLNGMPPKGSAGGTVNLVTKRATDDPLTRVTASYLSDSHFGGHLDVGRRMGENKQFGVRFNAVYRDGETAVKKQDKTISQVALGLDWKGERTRITADIYQSKNRGHGLTRGLSLKPGLSIPTPPKATTSWNPPWAFYEGEDKGAILRGEYDVNEQFSVYATAGINKSKLDTLMGTGQIFNQAGDFQINFSGVSERIRRESAEVGLKGVLDTGPINHQFAINATHFKEIIRLGGFRNLLPQNWLTNIYNPVWSIELHRPSTIPALTKTDTQLTSFGLADTMSFAQERVQLTLGVRRQQVLNESFNGTTGIRIGQRYKESATTPAMAIVVKATDHISLYANYIEGLSQGAIAPTTANNAGQVFAPYKTKQKEIGLKVDLGEFAHTISLYEIKRPSSYTDINTNIFSFGGEQRNRGVEWGFFGAVMPGVRLMGGVAYSDPVMTQTAIAANQGKKAVGLPAWQAKLGVEWDIKAVPNLTLTANATTMSKQYLNADNSLATPGRTLFDLGARYSTKISTYPLTLRGSITNLTNKTYWAQPHYQGLALGAPRTFMLSASMDF